MCFKTRGKLRLMFLTRVYPTLFVIFNPHLIVGQPTWFSVLHITLHASSIEYLPKSPMNLAVQPQTVGRVQVVRSVTKQLRWGIELIISSTLSLLSSCIYMYVYTMPLSNTSSLPYILSRVKDTSKHSFGCLSSSIKDWENYVVIILTILCQ